MASVPCRRPTTLVPRIVSTEILNLALDLRELLGHGLIEKFTDERGMERFRPKTVRS